MLNLSLNKNINFEDSCRIFCQMADGKFSDDETKDVLLRINQVGISEDLLLAAIQSFSKRSKKINISGDIFDVCGTGGDGLNTLNISTAVSFVVASLGLKVAKHGNRSVSSKSGSADIFSRMGIAVFESDSKIKKSIEDFNLAFIFAPLFHTSFKNVAKARSELGVKTIFNYLGPLLNPVNPNYQLIGCNDQKISHIMAKVCQKLNKKRVMIVHSFDGMDEISVSDKTTLLDINNKEVISSVISPCDIGIPISKIGDIKGGNPEYNYQRVLKLFSGQKDAYYDIVAVNAAYVLLLSGKFRDISICLSKVRACLDSGLPLQLLNKIKNG